MPLFIGIEPEYQASSGKQTVRRGGGLGRAAVSGHPGGFAVKSDAGGFRVILRPAIAEGEKLPGTPSNSLNNSTVWNGAGTSGNGTGDCSNAAAGIRILADRERRGVSAAVDFLSCRVSQPVDDSFLSQAGV